MFTPPRRAGERRRVSPVTLGDIDPRMPMEWMDFLSGNLRQTRLDNRLLSCPYDSPNYREETGRGCRARSGAKGPLAVVYRRWPKTAARTVRAVSPASSPRPSSNFLLR